MYEATKSRTPFRLTLNRGQSTLKNKPFSACSRIAVVVGVDIRPSRSKAETALLHNAADDEPLFFAALAEVHEGIEPDDRDGFVIITSAADQGMVDIHDRKPLVLRPELSREWIELTTTAARAEEIARLGSRPAGDFKWHPVSKPVGNVRNQGAELIAPVQVSEQLS